MKLIRPNVVLWQENQDSLDQTEHLVRCASVTHASIPSDIQRIKQLLIDSNHLSMFRHISYYAIVPQYKINEHITAFINTYSNNPFIEIQCINNCWFISTNHQFVMERPYPFSFLNEYVVTPREFIEAGGKNMIRLSMYVTTQVSTSRELNRVSPNSISEESTRFCNYSKDKFDNHVTICIPHWFDIISEEDPDEIYVDYLYGKAKIYTKKDGKIINIQNKNYIVNSEYQYYNIDSYLESACFATEAYLRVVNSGMKAQDARGLLPFDTATNVVYTYSIKEWKHILNLRYYGKTGKPHPNAFIIGKKIRDILANLGYENEFPIKDN